MTLFVAGMLANIFSRRNHHKLVVDVSRRIALLFRWSGLLRELPDVLGDASK